jgi:hypothetical protein
MLSTGTEHQAYSIPLPDDMDNMRVGAKWTRPLGSIVSTTHPPFLADVPDDVTPARIHRKHLSLLTYSRIHCLSLLTCSTPHTHLSLLMCSRTHCSPRHYSVVVGGVSIVACVLSCCVGARLSHTLHIPHPHLCRCVCAIVTTYRMLTCVLC